jgi:hypothetical protein
MEEDLVTVAKKAVTTTMVGAIVELEAEYRKLSFDHGFDADILKESLSYLRDKFFDCGNNQIRKINERHFKKG